MHQYLNVIYVILGLALLFFSADYLVRGCVVIADKLRLSKVFISVVMIGFGTSMPELLICLNAALDDAPDIALGNIIGSNITNVLFVLGLAAIIFPIPCKSFYVKRDALVGTIAALFLALLSFTGIISRFIGLAMLSYLITYLGYVVYSEQKQSKAHKQEEDKITRQIEKELHIQKTDFFSTVLITLGSLIFLTIGSNLLVKGSIGIADYFGVSQAVIGLSLVALGSATPELAAACVAAWRKHPKIVIGNVLGSNLFNILYVLGVVALIKPIEFIGKIANQDVWIMLAIMGILMSVIITGKQIARFEGVMFLILYVAYLIWLYV